MKRPLAIIGFTYLVMLGVCIFLKIKFILFLIFIFFLISIIFIIASFLKKKKFYTLVVTFFTSAFAMTLFLINYNKNTLFIEKFNDKNVTVSGELCDLYFENNGKYYYDFNLKKIDGESVNFIARISSKSPIEIDYCCTLTAKVYMFLPMDSPSFYAKVFYRAKGIYICAFLDEHEKYEVQMPKKKSLNYYILNFRKKLILASKDMFFPKVSGLINSIVLGEKYGLPKDVKKDFEMIGVYHFLVVSGLHISVISSFFFLIFKKICLNKRIAAFFSSIIVLAFLALLGFTPTAMRAGIVTIIYFLSISLFRKADSLNSLGTAVFLICLFNINAAFDLGLWLSCFSYLGIILISNKIQKYLKEKFKIKSDYILSSIAMTVSSTIFTLPLVTLFFLHISLISIISNLLLLWVVELLLCFSLIAMFVYTVYPMNFLISPLKFICNNLSNFILIVSKLLARIPLIFISLDFGYMKLWLCLVLILVGIAVIFLKKEEKIQMKFIFLISLNLLLIGVFSYQFSIKGLKRVTVLNCGEGLEVMVSKNNYEFGIIYPDLKTDETALEDYLLRLNTFSAPIYLKENFQERKTTNNMLEKKEIDDKIYLRLKIEEITFLIIPKGGNGLKIPSNWQNPDFLIASGLPINFKNIKPRNIILSMNFVKSAKNLKKIKNSSSIKAISTANVGSITVDINKKSKYIIRGAV